MIHPKKRNLVRALTVLVILQFVLLAIVSYRLAQADYGDLNHDGQVNLSDLSLLARHYHKHDKYKL